MRTVIVAPGGSAAEAVRRALRYAPTCEVVGWVDSSRPYVATPQPPLHVVVLDDAMGAGELVERVPELRAAHPEAKLVLLTSHAGGMLSAHATEADVDAAISKAASPAAVGTLVREIAAGHVVQFAPRSALAEVAAPTTALTNRELEILCLVADGLPNGRIAATLWVTEQTVKFHLSNIYRKLDVANRTQAAHYAYRHGLVDPKHTPRDPVRPSISVAA
jgi:DNA-binding NarL/FixJ family response regulator